MNIKDRPTALKQITFVLHILHDEELVNKRFTLKDVRPTGRIYGLTDNNIRTALKYLLQLRYLIKPHNHKKSYKFSENYFRSYMQFIDRHKAELAKSWLKIIMCEPYLLKIDLSNLVKKRLAATMDLTPFDIEMARV